MAHLYIIEGSGGLFKLGRTTNFATRLHALKAEFSRRGEKVARMHFFPDTGAVVEAELELRRQISERYFHCRHGGREWFRDVDFSFAIRCGNKATNRANRGLLKTATQEGLEFREAYKLKTAAARAEAAERRRIHAAVREVRAVGWMAPLGTKGAPAVKAKA